MVVSLCYLSCQDGLLSEVANLKEQLEVAQEEVYAVRKEAAATAHHRQTLRDAVEQLERMYKSKVDAIAETEFGTDRSASHKPHNRANIGHSTEEDDHHQRHVMRLRSKCAALEEVVSVYRTGLCALYPDGSSYGAAQYPNSGYQIKPHAHRTKIAGLSAAIQNGWLQREFNVLKKSFEEEIHLLEAETDELHGKLKQSNSYTSELRKRFEDNMKILYRQDMNLTSSFIQLIVQTAEMGTIVLQKDCIRRSNFSVPRSSVLRKVTRAWWRILRKKGCVAVADNTSLWRS